MNNPQSEFCVVSPLSGLENQKMPKFSVTLQESLTNLIQLS
jgi:hypothetical protein